MGKFSSPGTRLQAFRAERGLSGSALASDLGITKSTVSYWEAGRTPMPKSACLALQASHGVSAHWLMTGEGSMWAPNLAHAQPENGQHLVRFLDSRKGFGASGKVQPPHPETSGLGFPSEFIAELKASLGVQPEHLFIWRVADLDMAPTLKPMDWVLLDTNPTPISSIRDHGIYLVRLKSNSVPTLRRVATDPLTGELLVATDAPGRIPLRINPSKAKEGLILGWACWHGTKLIPA